MVSNAVASIGRSISKKQVLALTGFTLMFFILGHLAGNFMIYGGQKLYNGYAAALHQRSDLLWVVRALFLTCFIIHVTFAIRIYLENKKARGSGYIKKGDFGKTNLAKKTMIYSGLTVLLFIILHLTDFTFTSKAENEELGLYGLVWNSFLISNYSWRPFLYILVVCLLGLHLSHGVQSIDQTFGLYSDRFTPIIERLSKIGGLIVALAYSSIPIYVNIMKTPPV